MLVAANRPQPHVILLTIDALRYDRLSEDMPFLDSLAKESLNFAHAYSHGASTYWSVASMMTSKLPSRLHMGRDQTPTQRNTPNRSFVETWLANEFIRQRDHLFCSRSESRL